MSHKTLCFIQRLSLFAWDHVGNGEMPLLVNRVSGEKSGIVVTEDSLKYQETETRRA